jgi:acyl-CoA dehydrogenase family protein 9
MMNERNPRDTNMSAHLADPERNPSFIRGLFEGVLRENLVFPFPRLSTDEQERLGMVLASFRDFATAHINSARMDTEGAFDEEVRQGMHELGMMGVSIPEAYGGFGASALLGARIFAAVGEADAALGVYYGAHQSIGCKGIVLFGTEEQKQRWLPSCATGERIAAFCLTEPGSGSDAKAMRTTARRADDGDHYVLNGEKIWISNAGYAGVFTVFAKVPVTEGGATRQRVTAFIVDATSPGITLGAPELKMGIKASDTRTVSFQDVRVPAADRLGDEGQGFNIALEILNSGRLGLAAGAARGTRKAMDMAIAYANERQQFGRPIGRFEMLQHKIALAAAECYAADAGWIVAAGMMDRGRIDFSLETAACKIFASELNLRAALDAQQIAGGIGYSKEYPYEQLVRDARILLIFEGTNEVLRALIALSGLQRPGEQLTRLARGLKAPRELLPAVNDYGKTWARRVLSPPRFTQVHELLSQAASAVAKAMADFAQMTHAVLLRHRASVIERQLHQERMANVAIDLFLCSATLSRATAALNAGDREAALDEADCANLFIATALDRISRQLGDITRDDNLDLLLTTVGLRALGGGSLTAETPTDR